MLRLEQFVHNKVTVPINCLFSSSRDKDWFNATFYIYIYIIKYYDANKMLRL